MEDAVADAAYPELLAALDIVVVERLPNRAFDVLGPMPGWFVPIHTAASGGDTAELARAFPFLDHFLEDAAAHWRRPDAGLLKSGPYSATDANGVEFHFEVSTVLADRRIFLLFHLLRDFDDTRTVLQRARERTLDLQKVGLARARIEKSLASIARQLQALATGGLAPAERAAVEQAQRDHQKLTDEIARLPFLT
jgi:hypothetical protein